MKRLHDKQRRLQKAPSSAALRDRCIEIEAYFHLAAIEDPSGPIFPHPIDPWERFQNNDPTLDLNDFSDEDTIRQLIVNNMVVLNERFADTPFRFKLMNENNLSVY